LSRQAEKLVRRAEKLVEKIAGHFSYFSGGTILKAGGPKVYFFEGEKLRVTKFLAQESTF
jgi:hypothetical protein